MIATMHKHEAGSETFVVFVDESRQESIDAACRHIGRWAANPDIQFSWFDAALMCKDIPKTARSVPDVFQRFQFN